VFGSPARKSNGRTIVGNSISLLSPAAMSYDNIFEKQIKRIKENLDIPIDDKRYIWVFEIWYSDVRADASIELIFDLMEKYGLVTNDVTIRNYLVLSEELDKELPRMRVSIYKLKEGD